jgi:HD-GYP domain-containing protein (c-di-GMP phosphodiesterase class II)
MNQQRELLLANIAKLKNQQHELFLSTVANLTGAVGLRDTYTGDHSRRVTRFALLLGRQLHLSTEDLEVLRFATPLHDIGKIGIADAILRKAGPLTPEEFDVMKTHTTMGAKILEPVPDLRPALPIVRSHHERWDGHGYPDGVAGKDIPQLARIVAVADALDALVFDTPYRRGQSDEVAFAELEGQRGRQFDPDVVTVLLPIRAQIVQEMQRFETR